MIIISLLAVWGGGVAYPPRMKYKSVDLGLSREQELSVFPSFPRASPPYRKLMNRARIFRGKIVAKYSLFR